MIRKSKFVIYCDYRFPSSWCRREVVAAIVEYFTKRGFVEVNADDLSVWMKEVISKNIRATVVVFAQDVVPDTVMPECSSDTLIIKYLEADGRIVWIGDVPFYYQGHRDGTSTEWGGEGLSEIFGIEFYSEEEESVKLTSEGKKWGITKSWGGQRPVHYEGITYALTEIKRLPEALWEKTVNAWVKSGFVRIWDFVFSHLTNEMLEDLYRVATFQIFKKYYWEYESEMYPTKLLLNSLKYKFEALKRAGYDVEIRPLPFPNKLYRVIIKAPPLPKTGEIQTIAEIKIGCFYSQGRSCLGVHALISKENKDKDIQKLLLDIKSLTSTYSLAYVEEEPLLFPIGFREEIGITDFKKTAFYMKKAEQSYLNKDLDGCCGHLRKALECFVPELLKIPVETWGKNRESFKKKFGDYAFALINGLHAFLSHKGSHPSETLDRDVIYGASLFNLTIEYFMKEEKAS